MEYYSVIKKEWELAICNNMGGPRGYNAKWNKSDKEGQIPYDFTHTWNLRNKRKWTKKKRDKQKYREQTGGCQRGGG